MRGQLRGGAGGQVREDGRAKRTAGGADDEAGGRGIREDAGDRLPGGPEGAGPVAERAVLLCLGGTGAELVLRLVVVPVGLRRGGQARRIVRDQVRPDAEPHQQEQTGHQPRGRPQALKAHASSLDHRRRTVKPLYCSSVLPVGDVVPLSRAPVVTGALVVLTAAAFALQAPLDRAETYALARRAGVVPPDLVWTSLVAGPFVHDGWAHLLANLAALGLFGPAVEDALGRVRYALLYLGGAAAAALAHTLLQPSSGLPLVGAGGAVAAVLGAYFGLYPRAQILAAVGVVVSFDLIEVPATFFAALWLLLHVAAELTMGDPLLLAAGGSLFAVGGGFVTGWAVGRVGRGRRKWV